MFQLLSLYGHPIGGDWEKNCVQKSGNLAVFCRSSLQQIGQCGSGKMRMSSLKTLKSEASLCHESGQRRESAIGTVIFSPIAYIDVHNMHGKRSTAPQFAKE